MYLYAPEPTKMVEANFSSFNESPAPQPSSSYDRGLACCRRRERAPRCGSRSRRTAHRTPGPLYSGVPSSGATEPNPSSISLRANPLSDDRLGVRALCKLSKVEKLRKGCLTQRGSFVASDMVVRIASSRLSDGAGFGCGGVDGRHVPISSIPRSSTWTGRWMATWSAPTAAPPSTSPPRRSRRGATDRRASPRQQGSRPRAPSASPQRPAR